MKKIKLEHIILSLFIVFCCYGIITIVNAEEKAVNLVETSIETEEVEIADGYIEQSIELYTTGYKRRGTFVLLSSAWGMLPAVRKFTKNKLKK